MRRYKKRTSWVRKETNVKDILMTIKEHKWTWAEHVERICDTRWTTRVTVTAPELREKLGQTENQIES